MALVVVRNSEMSTFRKCRQQWYWSYVERLRPGGRAPALTFGSLCHDTLERFYIKGKRRGGKPYLLWEQVWAEYLASGGDDFNAAGDHAASDLGHAMMKGYWEKYGKDDEFEVIAPEMAFQVDVVHPETGKVVCIMTGQLDVVVRSLRTKKLGMLEHKTGAKLENFGAPLIMDEQAGNYWTFGPPYLRHLGLLAEDEDLSFILYNRLRKAMPDQRPKDAEGHALNKDGTISKNQPLPLFKREYTYRGDGDRASLHQRVVDEVREMKLVRAGKLPVYKNPGDACNFCAFRDMCEVHEVQSDWQALRAEMGTWDPYEAHNLALEKS